MTNPGNAKLVVRQLLSEARTESGAALEESEAMELFAARTLIRDASITGVDIEECVTDGGGDGQVDIAMLVDGGKRIARPGQVSVRQNAELQVVLIQATTSGFEENKLELLKRTVHDVLDSTVDFADRDDYNEALTDFVDLFRKVRERLRGKSPTFEFRVYFVSGASSRAHPRVRALRSRFQSMLELQNGGGTNSVELIGATDLVERQLLGLAHSENLRCDQITQMKIDSDGEYVAVAKLEDLARFLGGPQTLKEHLLDENVRDWERDVSVNKAIQESLGLEIPFWWQNNGITILCKRAEYQLGHFELGDPKIVNGLQTSREIHKRFAEGKIPAALRRQKVLVRVISTEDEVIRDRIIRATNSQTAVSAASLWASHPLHEQIEIVMRGHGLFYERRKNFYRNKGKKARVRVSTTYLAQSILSQALRRPSDARARPGDVFSFDTEHDNVFRSNVSLDKYVRAAEFQKHIDSVLRRSSSLEKGDHTNFRFHTSLLATARHIGYLPKSLAQLDNPGSPLPSTADVLRSFRTTKRLAERISRTTDVALDSVSKSPEFNKKVVALAEKL